MKERISTKAVCIFLALSTAVLLLSSCSKKASAPQFDAEKLADFAPGEYTINMPGNLYKDIDDINLSEFTVSSKKTDNNDNGDGTYTAINTTVYKSEDGLMTVEISTDASGSFKNGSVNLTGETGGAVYNASYSAPYKEIASVSFNSTYENHDSWSVQNYMTAYFDDETFMHAVYTYTVSNIKGNVTTPAYTSTAVYDTSGKLAAVYVILEGESDYRYYNSKYEPVSRTVYSILISSIQYAEYLLPDEKIASCAAEKLEVKLPPEVTNDFSEFKKSDDYVLTDTKANYYGDDLKDDNGVQFNTTTTFYKNEKNGYTVDMTVIDEENYLFVSHITCDKPKFAVTYRENGILDSYTDYDNNCRYSCYYNNDFSVSYYSMAYSLLCAEGANATVEIICEYDTEMKLLRYRAEYSFGLNIYYDAQGKMIEDDDFDLLNPAANYQ